jgi:ABC-type sugar transport system substrate-binding protein
MRGSRRIPMLFMVLSMLLALAVAGCGGSGGTSTGGSHSTAGDSAATKAAVAAAKKNVASLMHRPTSLTVPALPSKPPSGKQLDFIACGVPACVDFAPYLEQAAAAVGWHVKTLNAGLTPQTVAAAYDQAVRDKPAGVIGSGGYPTSLFSHQLQQLKAEGVPVVLHDQPPSNAPGVTAVLMSTKDNTEYGQEMADMIMADSGGHNVHLGLVITSQVPVFAAEHKALTSMVKSKACVGCTVNTLNFPETAVGTTLPSQVVSFLRANPSVNYLYFDFTDAVAGVPAALKAAGIENQAKILTTNLTPAQAQYIKDGEMWTAAALPWPETLWADFNVILHANMNLPTAAAAAIKLPRMIVVKKNLPSYNGQNYFPLVENYQSIFKKAWHVQ